MAVPPDTSPVLARDDESRIWEFIYREVCVNRNYKDVKLSLLMKYIEESRAGFDAEYLFRIYNTKMKSDLYNANISSTEILELYKFLEIDISRNLQEEMEKRFNAVLLTSVDRRLNYWHYNVVTTENIIKPPKHEAIENAEKAISEEKEQEAPEHISPNLSTADLSDRIATTVEIEIWNYIGEHFDTITSEKLASLQFWEEMLAEKEELKNFMKSPFQLLRFFQGEMLEAQFWCQKFNVTKKLEMIEEMGLPLDLDKYRWFVFEENVDLEISADGYLTSWKFREDELNDANKQVNELRKNEKEKEEKKTMRSISIPRRKSSSAIPKESVSVNFTRRSQTFSVARTVKTEGEKHRNHFTKEDDCKAWKYIAKRVFDKDAELEEVKPKGKIFWEDYILYSNSNRTADNWCSHFRKVMCRDLHDQEFSRATILKLYAHLNLEVTNELKNFLQKKFSASILLDPNRLIKTWKFEDRYSGTVDHEDEGMESGEGIGSDIDDEEDIDQEVFPSDKHIRKSLDRRSIDSAKNSCFNQRRLRAPTNHDMDSDAHSVTKSLRRQKRRRYEQNCSKENEVEDDSDLDTASRSRRNVRKGSRVIVETSSSDEKYEGVKAKRNSRFQKKSGGKNKKPNSSRGGNRPSNSSPNNNSPATRTRAKTQK